MGTFRRFLRIALSPPVYDDISGWVEPRRYVAGSGAPQVRVRAHHVHGGGGVSFIRLDRTERTRSRRCDDKRTFVHGGHVLRTNVRRRVRVTFSVRERLFTILNRSNVLRSSAAAVVCCGYETSVTNVTSRVERSSRQHPEINTRVC